MSTITKQAVQAVADLKAGYTLGHADVAILNELARIALASLEAEAVGEVVLGEFDDCGCHPDARVECIAADGQADWENFKDGTRLYTAPPAPVSVPAAMEIDDDFDSAFEHGKAVGWNAYRAAMLQAEPVSNSDELPLDYLQGHKDGLEWAAQLAEANHPQTGDWLYDDPIDLARAIRKGPDMPTVQGGNSPVIPDEVLSAIRKVARIRTDFDHFDGDRRGIADCLDEAEQELIVTINEHAAMLQGSQPVSKREQVRREHAEWSDKTFGDVGPVGPLKHLSKEALEAAAEPDDLSEWADMQFLLWDAQRRAGISDGEITAAMEEKLKVNMARQWPEPKDGEPRQHIQNDWQSCNHLLPIGELLKRLNEQTGEEWVSTTDLDYGKWVRCSDRMPAKRVNVLVSDAGGNKFICCHENGFWRDFRVGFSRHEIIHWTPLPAAPQLEVK